MVSIIEYSTEFNYKIYDTSDYLKINIDALTYESKIAHTKYLNYFETLHTSSRHGSKFYNIFSLTAGLPHFNQIYKFIKMAIFDYLGTNTENLFMQAWINYDNVNEVLDWHNHSDVFLCHGYISIDPKNSVTQFKDYHINNKPGHIYIGPSDRLHKVKVTEPYIGHRITIAFDVTNLQNLVDKGMKFTNQHCSFIPL